MTYGRQAGAKAVERSALREAAAAFEQALAALQHLPDSRATREQAIDLRFDLRNVLHPLNEEGRLLNHLRQAEPLAEALGDQRRLGHLAGYLSVCLRHQGHVDEALASAQRALAIATALGDVGLQVAANSFLGELYLWVLNDYRQAAEAYRRNVELLHGALLRERFGTTNVQSVVCPCAGSPVPCGAGRVCRGAGIRRGGPPAGRDGRSPLQSYLRVYGRWPFLPAPGGAVPGHTRVRTGAGPPRSCEFSGRISSMPCGIRCSLCPVRKGDRGSATAGASDWKQRQPPGIWAAAALFPVWLGEGYVLAGRLEEAMQLGQQALEVTRTQKQQGYQAYALRLLGDIAAHRTPPEVEEAERYYRQALALAEAIGMRPLQAHCHLGLGTLYAKTGQREQARAELATAIELYRAMEMTFWLPRQRLRWRKSRDGHPIGRLPSYDHEWAEARQVGGTPTLMVCTGPINYVGMAAVQTDIENFKAALQGVQP